MQGLEERLEAVVGKQSRGEGSLESSSVTCWETGRTTPANPDLGNLPTYPGDPKKEGRLLDLAGAGLWSCFWSLKPQH